MSDTPRDQAGRPPEPGQHVTASTAEIALGVLPEPEMRIAEQHLSNCSDCQSEVTSLKPVAAKLLELVPGTEPPLGFDRRVLASVEHGASRPPARRTVLRGPLGNRWIAASMAAAAAIVFGTLGWLVGEGNSHPAAQASGATAELMQQGQGVGRIETYGHPTWLTVSIRGVNAAGPVTCQVIRQDGQVITMGSFALNGGSGMWSTPDPAGMKGVVEARLVDTHGTVVAVARFGPSAGLRD